MKIEVSNGEIIDKYTILEIKLSKIKDPKKIINIQHEYNTLTPDVDSIYSGCKDRDQLKKLHHDLLEVNKKLWKIEDDIRECERASDFGQIFIDLARVQLSLEFKTIFSFLSFNLVRFILSVILFIDLVI